MFGPHLQLLRRAQGQRLELAAGDAVAVRGLALLEGLVKPGSDATNGVATRSHGAPGIATNGIP